MDQLPVRLDKAGSLHPSPLFLLGKKADPIPPNTLKEHMALVLRNWTGIEKASSHSDRRSFITNVIRKQKKSVKVAQKIAGHVNSSTTLIYEEPPEELLEEAMRNL